jgi:nuclear transport factor 2 (NTF2) superfamily protein
MPYDATLDVETFKEVKEFDGSRITVGVFSYNGNAKKLQLTRENVTQENEWRFAKLGRMTKEEAEAILPIMAKAINVM